MKRRDFLKTTAVAAAAAGMPLSLLSGCSRPAAAKRTGKLNISLGEGMAPGETLAQQLDFMEENGVVGLEPSGWNLSARVGELRSALQGRSVKVGAICAGFDGFILSSDPDVCARFDSTMRSIIDAAGELESTGVIMVPAFNGQEPCRPHTLETREYLTERLGVLGEYALSRGTTVILEPLNRGEAFFLRQVSDAAALCRESGSAGVKCMGDFWHMMEETSDYAAFMSAGAEYLQHVHIASRGCRAMPGEDGELDNYVEGFRALREMGYDKYVSFECGCNGDRSVLIPAALQLLRSQWEQA